MDHINRTGRWFVTSIALMIAAALGGCFRSNLQPGQNEVFSSAAEIAAKDDAICQGYGAKPGTPEYINCRGQQDQRRTLWRSSN